jgi:hypothetical protein
VEPSNDANSRDPGAWLRLAIARWLQGSTDDGALKQALALGASGDDVRNAATASAQLSLGEALLLAGHQEQGLQLLDHGRRHAMQKVSGWNEWEIVRMQACEALVRTNWRMAHTMVSDWVARRPCQVPPGMNQATWTELLLNACSARDGLLPAQRRPDLPSMEQAVGLIGHQEQPALQALPLRAGVRTGPPVTLTVISSRLNTLPAVLESLRQQTYRPAQVHLHLSQEAHLLDQGIATYEPLLQEITADGWVQLHWVPNLGPYRKIVPYLLAGGYAQGTANRSTDDMFITVDDDTLYPPRFIEYLVRNYERHACVVAHRGRRILLAEDEARGPFRPYAEWHDGVREPRLANLPTGQSGVLYRRCWFPQDLELEAALALAPTHDDLWLRWLTARQGVQAVILQPNAVATTRELAFPAASPEYLAKKQTLWHAYNGPAGGNDEAVVAVQAYWQARGFDLAALLAEEKERQADFY